MTNTLGAAQLLVSLPMEGASVKIHQHVPPESHPLHCL